MNNTQQHKNALHARTRQGELGQRNERVGGGVSMLWEMSGVAWQQTRRQPAAALRACGQLGYREAA